MRLKQTLVAFLFSLSILQGATLKINKEGNTINLFYISIEVKSLNQKISSKQLSPLQNTNTFDNNELLPVSAMYQKRAVPQQRNPVVNSFDSNFNRCLFTSWTSFVNRNTPVLQMPVKCQGRYLQLCYGTDPEDEDQSVCCLLQHKHTYSRIHWACFKSLRTTSWGKRRVGNRPNCCQVIFYSLGLFFCVCLFQPMFLTI